MTGTDRSPIRTTIAQFTSLLVHARPSAVPQIPITITVEVTGAVSLEITELGTDNTLHATGYSIPITSRPVAKSSLN